MSNMNSVAVNKEFGGPLPICLNTRLNLNSVSGKPVKFCLPEKTWELIGKFSRLGC